MRQLSILCTLAACIASGSAAAGPSLVAVNLPGVFAVAAPPAGFDPVRASDTDLATYGYPLRPSVVNHAAYANWVNVVHTARDRITPILRETHMAAGPAWHAQRHATPGYQTSQNWSAEVITTNAVTYGPGSFSQAAGWFSVPFAEQAFGACTGGWDHLFSWVGLDGWYNNEVFQAGTESDAYCSGGAVQQSYAAWYEWFPNLSVQIPNLPVHAGDVMVVWMTAYNNTRGQAFILNATSGQYTVIVFNAPAGVTLNGSSAEWVQERPFWNGVLSTLTNYIGTWMSTTGATLLNNGTVYTFGAPPPGGTGFGVLMLDNAGGVISTPAALGGNAVYFGDSGSAK